MRRIFLIGFVLLSFELYSSAQQTNFPADTGSQGTVADTPIADRPSKDQLLKLFEVMRLRSQMDTMLKAFPKALQQQMKSQIDAMEASLPGNTKLTPEQRESINKAVAKYMDEAFRLYPVEEMMDDMIPVYQQYLSRQDVEAILAFYQSSAGQHLLEKQPAMMQAIMPITMNKMQERSKDLSTRMMKEIMGTIPNAAPATNK